MNPFHIFANHFKISSNILKHSEYMNKLIYWFIQWLSITQWFSFTQNSFLYMSPSLVPSSVKPSLVVLGLNPSIHLSLGLHFLIVPCVSQSTILLAICFLAFFLPTYGNRFSSVICNINISLHPHFLSWCYLKPLLFLTMIYFKWLTNDVQVLLSSTWYGILFSTRQFRCAHSY
jgi:hypothetical protein